MRKLLIILALCCLIGSAMAADTLINPNRINLSKNWNGQMHNVTNGTGAQDVMTVSQGWNKINKSDSTTAYNTSSFDAYIFKSGNIIYSYYRNGSLIHSGTNLTDDNHVINVTRDYVYVASAGRGGTIGIGPGRFLISWTILNTDIPGKIRYIGAGRGWIWQGSTVFYAERDTTMMKFYGSASGADATMYANPYVQGIYFDGAEYNVTAINVTNCLHARITDNAFQDCASSALVVKNSYDVEIDRNLFNACGDPNEAVVLLTRQGAGGSDVNTDVKFHDNVMEPSYYSFVDSTYTPNGMYYDNYLEAATFHGAILPTYGIVISSGSERSIVSRNEIGIASSQADGIAIYINVADCTVSQNKIFGWVDHGSGKHGIYNTGAVYTIITGNSVYGMSDTGISFGGTYGLITSNQVRGNHYGIKEVGGADYNVISGNVAHGNVDGQITQTGANDVPASAGIGTQNIAA
ncbi:MAG: right-handed parallel beta-helix repeat-containing protein [Methanothrix sp.]